MNGPDNMVLKSILDLEQILQTIMNIDNQFKVGWNEIEILFEAAYSN